MSYRRLFTVFVLFGAAGGCSRSNRWDVEWQIHDSGQHLKEHLRDAQREAAKNLKEVEREAKPALTRAAREANDTLREVDRSIQHFAHDLKPH